MTLTVDSGELAATSGSGVTVSGSASEIQLFGSFADINAFFANALVKYTLVTSPLVPVTLTVNLSDNGNTGSGDPQQVTKQLPILYTAAAFNATFTSAPVSSCMSSPGCSSFTLNLAGVNFDFVITAAGSAPTMRWENMHGENNSPSMASFAGAGSSGSAPTKIITIKRRDGRLFYFDSIYIDDYEGEDVSISAFRGGDMVGEPRSVPQGTASTYSFGRILVDEVRLSATRFYTNFDSFKGAIPVPVVLTSTDATAAIEQVPTVIDAGLTVTDADSPTLHGASVAITSNFAAEQDVLGFVNNSSTMGDITGSYDSPSGVLTLTSSGGTATLAQWQAAIRSVTYTNTSDAPNENHRTVTFTVTDELTIGPAANKTISVTPINDPPVLTVPANIHALQNQASALTGITGFDPDAGTAPVMMTLSVASGALTAISGDGVTVSGSVSDTQLSGSFADINAFIAAAKVIYTPVADPPATTTFTVSLLDNGNTGIGDPEWATEVVTITISGPSSATGWELY
jgi:hypothetical protein